MDFKPTAERISLHGLGFIQVILGGNLRLHVWHPELPRRYCYEHSSVHDHRFSFESTVLVGTQINYNFAVYEPGVHGIPPEMKPTHIAYVHEGERSEKGNRPWIPREKVWVGHTYQQIVEAGETYQMQAYAFHSTIPGGDGKVATLMRKTFEGTTGARSLCEINVPPDVDFDRKQLSDKELWSYVEEVLSQS